MGVPTALGLLLIGWTIPIQLLLHSIDGVFGTGLYQSAEDFAVMIIRTIFGV